MSEVAQGWESAAVMLPLELINTGAWTAQNTSVDMCSSSWTNRRANQCRLEPLQDCSWHLCSHEQRDRIRSAGQWVGGASRPLGRVLNPTRQSCLLQSAAFYSPGWLYAFGIIDMRNATSSAPKRVGVEGLRGFGSWPVAFAGGCESPAYADLPRNQKHAMLGRNSNACGLLKALRGHLG